MSTEENNGQQPRDDVVQSKLTELAKGMKLMTSSITMLVKAINPTSAIGPVKLPI